MLVAQRGRGNIVEVAFRQHGRPHRARDQWRKNEADHDNHSHARRTERSESQKCNDDQWQREQSIDDATYDIVHDPTKIARHESQYHAEGDSQTRRQGCYFEYVASTDDNAREHVATELIRAEPMRTRGWI